MINFKKQDPVADSIKTILEKKELSPKQKAIAKMSPPAHKIDAGDLAKLRAGHKPVKSEGMDEEIDPKKTVTDTLRGREKKSDNPFLSKKVFMDVPGDVKEEAEQIDELKKSTVKSYIAKKSEKLPGKDPKKDMASLMRAHHRVTGVKPTSEGLTLKKFKELNEGHSIFDQMINEVLSKDASAGDWIHDFVHSDNPKFKGKSKEMRKKMALAAYYAKQRNEEVEHIEEVYDVEHIGGLHEVAKWRSTSVAKKVTDPDDHPDSVSYDYHHDNPKSTGMKKATSDTPEKYGSLSSRPKAQVTSQGARKGMITKQHAERLKSRIKAGMNNEEVEVEESTNPFSKDYKSQMPTKPGEKAGFTSKKISTGTVFTKKYKKDDSEEEKKK